jgi:ferrous iron transport protein B
LAILGVLMFFMFQAVFAWAAPLMDGVEIGMAGVSDTVTSVICLMVYLKVYW